MKLYLLEFSKNNSLGAIDFGMTFNFIKSENISCINTRA